MDRSAIRSRVRHLTGINMVELLSDVEANDYINEAYQDIVSLAEWSFLYAEGTVGTTASTSDYTLPASIVRAQDVRIATAANRQLLVPRTLTDMARYVPDEAANGRPWAWAPKADASFRVFPTPDAVYTLTVTGWKSVADLTADTSSPVFASQFHPVVAYAASWAILTREGDDSQRSDHYVTRVNWYLARMARQYLPGVEHPPVYPPGDVAVGEREEDR